MNQQKPMKAIAFLATALLLMSAPAFAQPSQGGGERPQPRGNHVMGEGRPGQGVANGPGQQQGHRSGMMEQLGLSAEQKQKVKALMLEGKTQSQTLSQQVQTKRQALMQYLKSSNASESKARAMNAEINDLQKQLSDLRLKTWFGMRSILTPEQLQKLSQMKPKHSGGMNESRRPGGMMPQGQMGPRRGGMQPGQMGPGGNQEGFGPRSHSGWQASQELGEPL